MVRHMWVSHIAKKRMFLKGGAYCFERGDVDDLIFENQCISL